MVKEALPTSMRLSAEVKAALAKAAADDERSVTQTVDRFLREALVARGYLPKPGSAPRASTKARKKPEGGR
jgi:hypothetical protein